MLTVPKPTPRVTVAKTAWKKTVQASVEVHPDGAAEVDCATSSPPLVRRVPPYVVGPHGLGLIRGTNTLARVERRFGAGRPSSRAGACSVTWRALGLGATFASCRPTAALVRARVTGARWSSLDGVRIGDGVARMRWQDGHARRLGPHRWLLGGVGAKGPPRLVAVLRRGAVVAFEIDVRP